MDMKYHSAAGLMMEQLPMPQSAGVDPWYRVGCGGDPTSRWCADGRNPLMERYCSAAAAAAAAAAKYGGCDTAMFGDKASNETNSVKVDYIQRYRSTSGYMNYRQPFIDVSGLYCLLCTLSQY